MLQNVGCVHAFSHCDAGVTSIVPLYVLVQSLPGFTHSAVSQMGLMSTLGGVYLTDRA